MKTVTQWFDGSVNPVHVGVYQRQYIDEIVYCMWDGKRFLWAHYTAMAAAKERIESPSKCMRWRGLAEEPKK